jgi:HD-like signal output (HDOD) protein
MPAPSSALAPAEIACQLDRALQDVGELPILPGTAQRALRLAELGEISLAKFGSLIESDAALAAGLLKLANSPLYSWGRTIDSLEAAAVRLGLRACHDLIMALGMKRFAEQVRPGLRHRCTRLWQHSFIVACLARNLSREWEYNYQGEEFTAGLLHDLGRLLLAMLVPDAFLVADPMTFEEDEELLDRERAVLGTDRCQVGARYAERSRMPVTIVTVIRQHHQVSQATQCRGLVALVAMADHLANHFHAKRRLEAYDLEQNAGFVALSRGRAPEERERFRTRLPALLRETVAQYEQSGLRG